MQEILKIERLKVSFKQYTGGTKQYITTCINDVSLTVSEGEMLAVLGESGSGKSVIAHAIFGILPANSVCEGNIFFKGELLNDNMLKKFRGKEMFLVPQTISSLDPTMKVKEALRRITRRKADDAAQKSVFKKLALDEAVCMMYPHELSGGMARRVLIAAAILSGARVLVLDEPISGIDDGLTREAIQLLTDLKKSGTSIVIILHDILTAVKIADRIAVLKDGALVGIEDTKSFIGEGERIKCEYARQLWNALPQNKFFNF